MSRAIIEHIRYLPFRMDNEQGYNRSHKILTLLDGYVVGYVVGL